MNENIEWHHMQLELNSKKFNWIQILTLNQLQIQLSSDSMEL